jgi:maltose O-acetyltransferase
MSGFWHLLAAVLLRLRFAFWRVVYRSYARRYRIHPAFRFNGVGIQLYGDGIIELGAESYISEFASVHACTGYSVTIGRRCKIADHVRIYTESTDPETDFRAAQGQPLRGNVLVGDGVWLGVNVYVAPGTTIGPDSVVGANSVVTRDIPAGEIWGGVPARRIRVKQGREGGPPVNPAAVTLPESRAK